MRSDEAPCVLVVDDEELVRETIVLCLERAGYRCVAVEGAREALTRLTDGGIDLILSDVNMPGMNGEELLGAIRSRDPSIPVVILTGFASLDGAVRLLRSGATDYLAKPYTEQALVHHIGRALQAARLRAEVAELRIRLAADAAGPRIIGESAVMSELIRKLPSLARSNGSVLLRGETGTGKETIARALNAMSDRARRPFVVVECGALPETLLESELFGHERGAFTDATVSRAGLIEAASGGTLFLDEVGDLSNATQVKLLRFLQEKEYRPVGSARSRVANVRIIATTQRDLAAQIAAGRFRQDLLYRLDILSLDVPPLRQHKDDVPALAAHFLAALRDERGRRELAPLTLQRLLEHDWPGNVRELRNQIRRMAVLSPTDVILPEHVEWPRMPSACPEAGASPAIVDADGELIPFAAAKRAAMLRFERDYLNRALALSGGNISAAARLASKPRRSFWQLLRRHGLLGRRGAAGELVGTGAR